MVSFWELVSGACGVIYFSAWSLSFYPQLLLNFKRKSTLGLSPDFVAVNPIGFFCLAIWSWGAFFSRTARKQYADRHDGHYPQVSISDLAFSAHALLLAILTLGQVIYYRLRAKRKARLPPTARDVEEQTLLIAKDGTEGAPTTPLMATRLALLVMGVGAVYELASVAMGRTQLLDFLYFCSSLKIGITMVKYAPQVWLNWHLKTVRGFSIAAIICDMTGGIFSLLQLVISAVVIDGQPAGIWANPGKLGLSLLSIAFDIVFVWQKYVLYPQPKAVAIA